MHIRRDVALVDGAFWLAAVLVDPVIPAFILASLMPAAALSSFRRRLPRRVSNFVYLLDGVFCPAVRKHVASKLKVVGLVPEESVVDGLKAQLACTAEAARPARATAGQRGLLALAGEAR